jgi:nucleotide-binding universal stress UspA family protein
MRSRELPKTILLATDFSDTAAAAMSWAGRLAGEYGSRLIVVHASLPEPCPAPEFVVLPAEYYETIQSSARRRLDEEAASLRKHRLEVDVDFVTGPAVDGIQQAAARHGADLIVVGTRGRTGWKKLLLGSTAARVVRDAPCPVLTVSPHAHPPGPIHTMLAATDFSIEASRASRAATNLLWRVGPHKLVLLHVYRMPNEAVDLPTGMVKKAIAAAAAASDARLEGIASELRSPDLIVEPLGRSGYPPEVILEHAEELGVDLIAMGTHGRSGLDALVLGSTAQSVIAHAHCPVLTVPGHEPGFVQSA